MQQQPCNMYVNYESLLVGLSRTQFLDIDNFLALLLERAQRQFDLREVTVLGDWTIHNNRAKLEGEGFLCQQISLSWTRTEIDTQMGASIIEHLSADNMIEVYLLVSETFEQTTLIEEIYKAGKKSILWTLAPPSPSNQIFCADWELIAPSSNVAISSWSRKVTLQAIALAADRIEKEQNSPFALSLLEERLQQLRPYVDLTHAWLAVALNEQVILLEQSGTLPDNPCGFLNRQHVLVRSALQMYERSMNTFYEMLEGREWVAFSALEKALRSTRVLADSQKLRQHWLEVLLAEGLLISEVLPQPDGAFSVTVLRPGSGFRYAFSPDQWRRQNIVQLIATMGDLTVRKGSSKIGLAYLLELLTNDMTRIEARATFRRAQEQGIIEIDLSTRSHRRATQRLSPTVATLQKQHPLVQEVITQLDHLHLSIGKILVKRGSPVSEQRLTEDLAVTTQMTRDEINFWLRTLCSQGVLKAEEYTLAPAQVTSVFSLNTDKSAATRNVQQTDREEDEADHE